MGARDKESKPGLSLTKSEGIALGLDKSNWADAAHWGMNKLLEEAPLNKIPGSAVAAKIAGPPLELAKIAGEAAYVGRSPESREKNLAGMKDLAGTSLANRLISGYTNTAQNLIGGAQLANEYVESRDAAEMSEVAYENMRAQRMVAPLNQKADEEQQSEMFASVGINRAMEMKDAKKNEERERLAREAFEDEHLGEITMNMVAKYVRGGV